MMKATKRELRNFGILFAIISGGVAGYLWLTGSTVWTYWVGGGVFFLVSGLFMRPVLRPLYVVWMKFAALLAWINTRIILTVFFYVIITPIGLIMRTIGRDPLQKKISKETTSYWVRREQTAFDRSRLEKQF